MSGKEWDLRRHVQEVPTDAFGDLIFTGLGQKIGKYVRVSSSTPPRVIFQLMTQHWGLDIPNLLISVTGGAKNFNMKLRLKNIFRRGLVKVAQTTGAWIITGGSHAGVMKQVGEAVRDFSMSSSCKGEIITIGVATWGTVHNRNSLICPTAIVGQELGNILSN
uniref:TRPM SLOG domain-containing protein n=1 Tax=Salvator merianae TaxID=96440 RepID=A0A8D0EAT2_SALMN